MKDNSILFTIIGIIISTVVIICFMGFVIVPITQESYSNETMTQEEARYQYCLIETQLKYPTSSTDIIKRLCELEQIGRLK